MTARPLPLLLPVALLGASLLAGCTAGDSRPGETSPAASPSAESSAPAGSPSPTSSPESEGRGRVDAAVLEGWIQSAGLTPVDLEAMGGVDALSGSLAGAEIEPAECAAAVEGSLALSQMSEASFAVGIDEATGESGGIVSFADDAAAEAALQAGRDALEGCAEIRMTMPDGTEVSSAVTEVPASIDGADTAFGSQTVATVEGAGELTTVTTTAQVGSLVVTGTSLAGDTAAAEDIAQRLADAAATD